MVRSGPLGTGQSHATNGQSAASNLSLNERERDTPARRVTCARAARRRRPGRGHPAGDTSTGGESPARRAARPARPRPHGGSRPVPAAPAGWSGSVSSRFLARTHARRPREILSPRYYSQGVQVRSDWLAGCRWCGCTGDRSVRARPSQPGLASPRPRRRPAIRIQDRGQGATTSPQVREQPAAHGVATDH
ncbi:hypothetical protein PVAP13_6NG289180 [Panicum virgatum]|uniref:Uncharacterized protein n=1 Tax=Panicum virgatum TaxID=38727 RepID=A0A8T0R3D8_PANVG|nr:hypothetical protein PVAP13_6NG289180 [Panicum virgatum]